MQEAKIKFDHVTKVFETRSQTITAVKDYSMEIQAGEFISILGPSGCGRYSGGATQPRNCKQSTFQRIARTDQ